MFLIKYLTCQNYRQLMFLRLSAGPRTAFPTGWGTVGWFRVPVTPALSSLTPREPKPSPDLARFLGGRCLMGQMQNPRPSPIILGSSYTFEAPRIEGILWRNELYSLWTPENASDCFRNLGWLYQHSRTVGLGLGSGLELGSWVVCHLTFFRPLLVLGPSCQCFSDFGVHKKSPGDVVKM